MTCSFTPADEPDATRLFDERRDFLIAVAYRVLGSVADAEDVVQEAWLRWSQVDPAEVENSRAFLVRVTTRLAIDRLRRVKARREAYVGPWLPEPMLTGSDVAEEVELAESISMAMLVVLETLSPLERAVFVLREAFGMPYAEIAEVIGRKEEAVRQLAKRARDHVRERRSRFEADHTARQQVTERFLEATSNGDLDVLMEVLAPGVTLVADGGGRVLGPRRPIYGADKVARFLSSITTEKGAAKFLEALTTEPRPDLLRARIARVNGGPGIVVTYEGIPITTITLDVIGGVVQTIYMVVNPDKMSGISESETH